MKRLAVFLGLVSFSAWANGPFTGLDLGKDCSGARVVDSGYGVRCYGAEKASVVLKAKAGANAKLPKALWPHVLGAIELGLIPDADTNTIYYYTRRLIDGTDRTVGYLVIEGIHNPEMEVKFQVTSRYNLKGQLVSAAVK